MADKNGAGDSQEKSRAAKRRDKKKKELEKKRMETKESSNLGDSETEDGKSDATDGDRDEIEEETFDRNSAFIAGVVSKKKIVDAPLALNKNKTNANINILGAQIRRKIEDGLRLVEQDRFEEAAKIYTNVIDMHPDFYAFYGNRSYCYERLCKYDLALQDANKALSLNAKCAVNHYRKASALIGLQRFGEAESALIHVLKIDPKCREAREDLILMKKLKLSEMGFSERMSEFGARNYANVDEAVADLLKKSAKDFEGPESDLLDDIYVSDEEDLDIFLASVKNVTDPLELDPTNPRKLKVLWLGNLSMDVTEQQIKTLFSKYGTVEMVTCSKVAINERQYAFINFSDHLSPGKAMLALQGYLLGSCEILIKFPIKKLASEALPSSFENRLAKKPKDGFNRPMPVNGDECYFWRNQGFCSRGTECRFKHIKANKAIDRAN